MTNTETKTQLKGLNLTELQAFVEAQNEPRYRAQQLFRWMYHRKAAAFDEMTDLPKAFREKLKDAAQMNAMTLDLVQASSQDDSRKYLFKLQDDYRIECVLMFERDRRTLCVSTQVGCPIDCKFCATGAMGIKRNLTAGEILDQVLAVEREYGDRITNIVVMGMGEPMLNYENMMTALDILSAPEGLDISKRQIVVSTSGLIPAIKKFHSEKRKYRLAISLNATTDETRTELMPLNKKWPIRSLLKAVSDYARDSRERVTFEYVLLDGVNDTMDDARRLTRLVTPIRCKVNLIPYNTTYRGFQRPPKETIERFYREMKRLEAPVTIRWSKGVDIDAACGQLWTKVENSKKQTPIHK